MDRATKSATIFFGIVGAFGTVVSMMWPEIRLIVGLPCLLLLFFAAIWFLIDWLWPSMADRFVGDRRMPPALLIVFGLFCILWGVAWYAVEASDKFESKMPMVSEMNDAEKKATTEIHNVTSHNQSGGITAHTVNLGPPLVEFGDAERNEILAKMPKDEPVRILVIGGPIKAIGQIQEFLRAHGYQIGQSEYVGVMSPPRPKGFRLHTSSGSRQIEIVF